MRILRCCVIDDEPLAARLINDYIEKTPFFGISRNIWLCSGGY